jgi:hypothetical protein
MLKYRTPFHDLGAQEYEERAQQREVAYLQKRAAKLGFALTPTATGAANAASF